MPGYSEIAGNCKADALARSGTSFSLFADWEHTGDIAEIKIIICICRHECLYLAV